MVSRWRLLLGAEVLQHFADDPSGPQRKSSASQRPGQGTSWSSSDGLWRTPVTEPGEKLRMFVDTLKFESEQC